MRDDMFEVPRHVLDKLNVLREALEHIQEMAEEDIRTGKAEGTFLYQIESDARAALQR